MSDNPAAKRDPSLGRLAPGRRGFVAGVLAVAGTGAKAQPAPAAADAPPAPPRLTAGEAGRGPSRFHPSFVKDVGLLTNLNPTNQGGAWYG